MRPTADWIGRRWFEMRIGYSTYMAFTFGFANFILLLHGLTDWFKDYPLHWFGIAMLLVIIPVSVAVGHRHNRTQQKTETRNLTHLHPYINLMIPHSKEIFYETYVHGILDTIITTTRDPELKIECEKMRAALVRYMAGETATGAMDKEGVRRSQTETGGATAGAGAPAGGDRV